MNLVDSSGWLEYFSDGLNAESFSGPLNDSENLIVPTICLYEVFKIVLRERNEDDAMQALAVMQRSKIIELTSEIAIQAAKISFKNKLHMADSIILTTA
ncbi:PIN domain-containing protein [candidate division KSB1 bacterium]|nr:PIN domain-containing protein [candidate division KSB1 bacterium]